MYTYATRKGHGFADGQIIEVKTKGGAVLRGRLVIGPTRIMKLDTENGEFLLGGPAAKFYARPVEETVEVDPSSEFEDGQHELEEDGTEGSADRTSISYSDSAKRLEELYNDLTSNPAYDKSLTEALLAGIELLNAEGDNDRITITIDRATLGFLVSGMAYTAYTGTAETRARRAAAQADFDRAIEEASK